MLCYLDNAVLPGGSYTLRLDATDGSGRLSRAFTKVIAGDIPWITSITPSPALPGEMITITGFAFGSTQVSSYVSFSGFQATTYLSWSDSEITVLVPLGLSGTVTLTVTTQAGTSDPVIFTVLKNTTDPLAAGLYTIEVRTGENSYYARDQIRSSELITYNPTAGTSAFVGQFWASGFKDANYEVGYQDPDDMTPSGNLFSRDSTVWWDSKWAQATSFDYLVIPPEGTGAWIAGSCTYKDTPGYTFSL